MSLAISILGPIEVEHEGAPVVLGPKQQALLAILLVHRGEAVSVDRILDLLYAEGVPRNGAKTLQVHVSRLRRALGNGELIRTAGAGYQLVLPPGDCDADRFEELASRGHEALIDGDPLHASITLVDALALWRGAPLAEFAYEDFAQSEIARLAERRLAALEDRIDADLALGRHAALAPELEALVEAHPLRERLIGQLMLALYRSGRQAEALATFQRARSSLVDELGIDPGTALRGLERAILQQDPSLELPLRPAAAESTSEAAPPTVVPQRGLQTRKTVTALAAAISRSASGGVALDPEALRRVTSVVFTQVTEAVAAHGGKVESVSAEEMSAVFGVPEVHEDDAVRAVRAATEIHQRLAHVGREHLGDPDLGLDVRIGVSTGEVVAGGALAEALLVTGTPFIKAGRLAEGAAAGETLLDHATVRLVGRHVQGDHAIVGDRSVFRLAQLVEPATAEPRFTAPMVGRERERRRLADAYEQAIADRRCQLFTILGAAGVGKSRLVQEFLGQVGGALVARGRCLPYGEGITFWPVLEAVKELVEVDDEAPETTVAGLAELIPDADDPGGIAERIADMIGLSEARVSAEERVTAMRRFVEGLGRPGPFVLVFDDIHWGEETFLDLVEYLADWCRDATVLLICMARPELLDARPGWGGGKLNATSVLLEPLSEDDCDELVGHLLGAELPPDVATRITQTAEGNPLFVEEMLAMLVDDGLLVREGSRWVATPSLMEAPVPVPPTISGLLAARLDRLPPTERAAIERAAVEGKVFHRSSVQALSEEDGETSVADALRALLRKELIRPDRPVFPDEDAYRFRHLLIRDAAYEAVPKQLRAELHERHAAWLQERIAARTVEYDEIVGYHLEQAYGYCAELGPVDEEARIVGRRAAELLGAAGRRAFLRSDAPAGAKLLARAVAMLRPEDPLRVELVPNVRVVQGLDDLSWADRVLTEAVEASATTGDRRLAAQALVQRGLLRLFNDPDVTPRELFDVSERAVAVFEELHDELGLARAWRLAAQAHYLDRHAERCAEASERALLHARRVRDAFEEQEILEWLVIALILGPTPASSALSRCQELLRELDDGSFLQAEVLCVIAPLLAMQRREADADAAFARAHDVMVATGERVWIELFWHSFVNLWRGVPGLKEQELRSAYESLKTMGEKSHFSSLAHALANIVLAQGRYEEAERLTIECEEASRKNDVHSQIAWRSVRARVLANRGASDDALSLALEAMEFGATSDFLIARAESFEGLAEVLELVGRRDEAIEALGSAVALYEEKGNLLAADVARARLIGLST